MTESARWLQRAHPWFVAVVATLGLAVIASAVRDMVTAPPANQWILMAVLTLATGAFAVKVPALNATLSISETFLFAMAILAGPAPAVATLALDGVTLAVLRRRRSLRQIAFNIAEPALSMWVATKLYVLVSGLDPLLVRPAGLSDVGLPALLMAGAYFLMNSVLNALAMATESGTSPFALWRKYFLWVSLNYFGGMSIAVLLAVNTQHTEGLTNLSGLLAITPLILVSYFTFKSSMGRLEDENVHLAEVNRLYLKVVETLAMAVDAKDQVTHGHIRRVQTFALRLARSLGVTDSNELKAIEAAALLHDMGKLAVPEHILNKPGKLTDAEYARMKLHAPLGADMLSAVDFPYPVVPIVRHHHENWDGTGYPDAIAGDAIPIGARILSVVDCYDALRSHRPYRRALTPDQALAIVEERSGTMYDPAVVKAFAEIREEIEAESVDEPLPDVLDRFARAARDMRTGDPEPGTLSLESRLQATDALLHLHEHLSRLPRDLSVDDTCDVINRYLRRLTPSGLIVYLTRDESSESLQVLHASGYGERCLDGLTVPMGHGISGWVAANRQSVLNADPALDVETRFDTLTPKFHSVMSVPLTHDGGTLGALAFYAVPHHAFTDDHRRMVELLSATIADTIAQTVAKRSVTSSLAAVAGAPDVAIRTLLNRGSLWAASGGRSMGVLYLRGTDDGATMAHAAVAVNQATRVADLIFRVTPDELVVLMPDCDPAAGQMVAGRVAEALLTEPAGAGVAQVLNVGFACSPYDGATMRDLFESARRKAGSHEAGDRAAAALARPVTRGAA